MSQFNAMNANLSTLAQAPWLRQLLILVGIAASVAVGIGSVMWSQGPDYKVLYGSLAPDRASAVVDTLNTLNIPYKIENATGSILVPNDRLHDARLKLAGSGLATGDGSGLEMMKDEKGFGVSEFMETKKYQHAIETELSRTIESLHQVRRARVHLAIPKQSVFVRERKTATASIFLDVFPGSVLEKQNVKAIVNLVASSIPDLTADQVTVVDQQGNLLSDKENDALAQGSRQFDYRQRVEKTYESRIEQLISPIVASGKVRVQVAADIDFASSQVSRESWNPESQVVRSEQINSDSRGGNANAKAAGIPGALSNQPVSNNTGEAEGADAAGTTEGSKSITRNYEIERTLNHSDTPAGTIKRLSVAVVVDGRPQKNAEGKIVKAAPNAAELERLTMLVQNAVGYEAERGDKVTVLSADFIPDLVADEADAPGFWQEAWFAQLMRQGLTGLGVLLLVLLVLRPAIKNLLVSNNVTGQAGNNEEGISGVNGEYIGQHQSSVASLSHSSAPLQLGHDFDKKVSFVRTVTAEDPKRVAQVVKNWVNN
ncbi:flagellar basal-body MS-ring/collar protein FliF [Paraperlucidibaca wandonensis]|jgi:flagellar M-ring protein FliF|uniref:Flagellar M-ring protein n=1 Tax=Paraperlucidibaca wandonensis TaxID=1268273 RepID=A0ABW3HE04_9GAMM|tara:strand:+ start:9756 stop:11384 length:1629 start_codon:yes stop_codon:yes gene_type:complete